MAVSPHYAQSLLGQWVHCHSAYGVHVGILQEVRYDGIVLGIHDHAYQTITGERAELESVRHADEPEAQDAREAFFFPGPFVRPFFVPYPALYGLRPYFYW